MKAAVAIDTLSLFRKKNPQLSDEKVLHTFLLNKDNKVVLVGNPIHNERIKDLIFKKISEAK